MGTPPRPAGQMLLEGIKLLGPQTPLMSGILASSPSIAVDEKSSSPTTAIGKLASRDSFSSIPQGGAWLLFLPYEVLRCHSLHLTDHSPIRQRRKAARTKPIGLSVPGSTGIYNIERITSHLGKASLRDARQGIIAAPKDASSSRPCSGTISNATLE
jgi:hypothetical protein